MLEWVFCELDASVDTRVLTVDTPLTLTSFGRFLYKELPKDAGEKRVEFDDELDESGGEVSVPTETGTRSQDDEEVELSTLVERINEALGTEFTEADQLFLNQVKEDALESEKIRQAAKVNSEDNFALEFDSMLTKLFIDRRDQNQELFQKFMDNDEVQDIITEHLRKAVYEASQETEA